MTIAAQGAPCTHCEKPIQRAASPTGRTLTVCIRLQCRRARCRAYHAANREAVRARKRADYLANREAIIARKLAWYHANIDQARARVRASSRKWYRAHWREYLPKLQAQRRAAREAAKRLAPPT